METGKTFLFVFTHMTDIFYLKMIIQCFVKPMEECVYYVSFTVYIIEQSSKDKSEIHLVLLHAWWAILLSLEIYNDDFFQDLDGVCNALDNVDASKITKRVSMFNPCFDRRCYEIVLVSLIICLNTWSVETSGHFLPDHLP